MSGDELNARFSAIQASIRAEGQMTRRHIDAFAESLRAEIRRIMEPHGSARPATRIPSSDTLNERGQQG